MPEWITGRNPVFEVLRAGRRKIHQLQVAQGVKPNERLSEIQGLAKKLNIPIASVPRANLAKHSSNHQGVALQVGEYPYSSLVEMLEFALEIGQPAFILVLDSLQDPQNLGTLLRTAEAFGVHGVLLPLRGTATVTPAVVNSSSGASEHLLIAQTNLAQAITALKTDDVWVVGLEAGGESMPPDKVNLNGALAIVVGSEGSGLRRLVRESCDFLMQIPMQGQVASLNAAVAGSIALYLASEARISTK